MNRELSLVRHHMTPSIIAVSETTPLEEVLKTLLALDVSSALVAEPGSAPTGVVSLSDLARVSRFEASRRGPFHLVPPSLVARDVMTPKVIGVSEDATVEEAVAKMLRNRIHRLFVVRRERPVGVFSTRDALRVVLARRLDRPLRSVMSAPVETVSIGDSIAEAMAKLDEKDVRGLVVVDGTFPVGVFTHLEAIRARALPEELRNNPVEELMSYEMIALDAETPVYRAAGQAIAMRTRRIAVVDGRTLVGLVTGYDLAQVLA